MSKKHFEALADALAMEHPIGIDAIAPDGAIAAEVAKLLSQWNRDIAAVADVCARFNGNFDRGRFLAACRERFS